MSIGLLEAPGLLKILDVIVARVTCFSPPKSNAGPSPLSKKLPVILKESPKGILKPPLVFHSTLFPVRDIDATTLPPSSPSGDPYGNRTHDYAVRGRRLSRLTKGPSSKRDYTISRMSYQ